MKTIHWIIIGVSIPVALFGIFALVIAVNIIQMHDNSDRWMVELEPHLDLTDQGLWDLIRNDENSWDQTKHDEKERIKVYRLESLDEFAKDLPSDLHGQLQDADLLDNRFVLYVDKNTRYSDDEIQKSLIEIDGIKDAQKVFDWMLGKD